MKKKNIYIYIYIYIYINRQNMEGCQIPFRSRKGCRKGHALARFC